MEHLIKRLEKSVAFAEIEGENMDDVSWGMQEGILISYNEAKAVIEALKAFKISSAEGKKALNADEAWKIQEDYKGKQHGWVQWKGTYVCMDIYCKCGHHSHIDADFAYHVKCPSCGTVYMCNGHIELIELEQEPESCVIAPEMDEM